MLTLLLASTFSFAAPTTVPVLETDESEPGEGSCVVNEAREVELTAVLDLQDESWVELTGFEAVAEARHALCDVYLDDLIVEIDGSQVFSQRIAKKGFGEDNPGFFLNERITIPDLEKTKLGPGRHTLTFRLEGSADSVEERLRLTVTGTARYGRDWDDDNFDDIELADGTDCDDDDPAMNPGADEIWYDGVDQDCAGDDDFDQDGDGFQAEGEIDGGDDCVDTRDDAYPGAPEIWYDGIDQDCAGDDDFDQDGDGFQSPDHGGEDCDDQDGSKYPGARTWDDNCEFIVRSDDSRTPPEGPGPSGTGCSRGAPAAALFVLLPLFGIQRRRA